MKNTIIIIMAGGLGKRMQSDLPKVLHKINGIPMLARVIEQANLINPKKIIIVVGKYRDVIEKTLSNYISLENVQFIIQPTALGTGHAIQCCRDELLKHHDTNVVILSGDTPLIKSQTIKELLTDFQHVKLVTTSMENPFGYGRIVERNNIFERITEEKDCTQTEQLIKKVNCGIYAFDLYLLCKYLPLLTTSNSQQEYYLTDMIELIQKGEQIRVDLIDIPKDRQLEIMGVNTPEQLKELEQHLRPISLDNFVDFSERWSYR